MKQTFRNIMDRRQFIARAAAAGAASLAAPNIFAQSFSDTVEKKIHINPATADNYSSKACALDSFPRHSSACAGLFQVS